MRWTTGRVVLYGVLLAAIAAIVWVLGVPGARIRLSSIHLPPGFHIAVFADSVPNARSLALGSGGTVFVGSREAGAVYALRDRDGDGSADSVYVLARGLLSPNGVAFQGGALYVAEISRILRFDSIETRLARPPAPVIVYDRLPREGHHGWRYIGFGPDSLLYVASGVPCNICVAPSPVFGTMLRFRRPIGATPPEIFAAGIRNSVGFDWDPATRDLWFTDNGRDWLGADAPDDELNHAPRAGMHFGFPFCHQGNLLDPEFAAGRACAEFTPPAALLDAHVAALGMRFYTGEMFPPRYRGVFIAEHGSWNRIIPVGYRVVLVRFEAGRATPEVFAQGWLGARSRPAWGRPVDVLVMPDGALLVSDDRAGAVYRISYLARP